MAKVRTGSKRRLDSGDKDLLKHLITVPGLNNTAIGRILQVDEGRRRQLRETGTLSPKPVAKNAEKLRPWHLEKVLQLLEHDDRLQIKDIREFLRAEHGLEVSASTISRQLKRAQKPRSQRPGYNGNKAEPMTPSTRNASGSSPEAVRQSEQRLQTTAGA